MQVTAAATPNSIGAHAVDASKMAMSDHAIRLGPTARPFVECVTMRQSMKHTLDVEGIARNMTDPQKDRKPLGRWPENTWGPQFPRPPALG
jgi:hypothetical protein